MTDRKEVRRQQLARLLNERFGGVQARLAKAIGKNPNYVSRCLAGTKGIGEGIAHEIEERLRLPRGWMDDADSPEPGNTDELSDSAAGVARSTIPAGRVPVVGHARLGDNGHFVELQYPVGHGDGFLDMPSNDENAYAVRCEGDSMTPRIRAGEFVLIEPNHPVSNGDEVLVKARDGRVMVKQFLYRRDGAIRLLSVNEAHSPITLQEDEVVAMHYVAAIVKSVKWFPGEV